MFTHACHATRLRCMRGVCHRGRPGVRSPKQLAPCTAAQQRARGGGAHGSVRYSTHHSWRMVTPGSRGASIASPSSGQYTGSRGPSSSPRPPPPNPGPYAAAAHASGRQEAPSSRMCESSCPLRPATVWQGQANRQQAFALGHGDDCCVCSRLTHAGTHPTSAQPDQPKAQRPLLTGAPPA